MTSRSTATAAREFGMEAVWFRSTEQALADVEAALH